MSKQRRVSLKASLKVLQNKFTSDFHLSLIQRNVQVRYLLSKSCMCMSLLLSNCPFTLPCWSLCTVLDSRLNRPLLNPRLAGTSELIQGEWLLLLYYKEASALLLGSDITVTDGAAVH
jgi:hypothetical protein